MELIVEKGKGYVAADKHDTSEQILGMIPIDSIFNPVIEAEYVVEDSRVGQVTNYDRLILKIETNGSILPHEALSTSADIIRELRYNDGNGYFWVDTSEGINVVLLGRDTEGQSRWDATDSSGNKFIQQMIENGMQEGGGYTQLMFAKPNETEELPKINFTAYYEPFDWVMGTGVWIDDLDALELEYSNNAHAALLTSVRNTVIILAVLIAIGFVTAFYFGDKLTKPIKMATSQMVRMSNSDFTENDEIAAVRKLQ
jgi:methyl-accepting chemotaxis protein